MCGLYEQDLFQLSVNLFLTMMIAPIYKIGN